MADGNFYKVCILQIHTSRACILHICFSAFLFSGANKSLCIHSWGTRCHKCDRSRRAQARIYATNSSSFQNSLRTFRSVRRCLLFFGPDSQIGEE